MTKFLLLAAAAVLVPVALDAATPANSTNKAVKKAAAPATRSTAQSPRAIDESEPSDTGPRRVAPAASLGGAPIPGLCMLSQSAVLTNAKVALAADARLKIIQRQIQTELQAEQTAINDDAKLLEGQRSAPDFAARQAALQARANALQQKAQLRERELQATRQKALNRISTEAQPIIAQAFRAHDCSLLIDRNSVLLGNMANDITAEVARGLDAKISTITFERERLAQ